MIEYPIDPLTGDVPFVARPQFVEGAIDLIKGGRTTAIVLGDTHAIYGTGKTTALSRLFHLLKADPAWLPVWLSLDHFSVFKTNTQIEDFSSIEALQQNFDDFKLLLITLGRQIDKDAFAELPETLDAITSQALRDLVKVDAHAEAGSASVGSVARLDDTSVTGGDANVQVTVNIEKEALRVELNSKRILMAEAFRKIFASLDLEPTLVVVADDFCWIIDQFIGDWFLQLTQSMDRAVILIARTTSDSPFKWPAKKMLSLDLDPFTVDEVCGYLHRRGLAISDRQLALVYRFSHHGHPLLVSLAGDLLSRFERREATSDEIDAVLHRLVGKQEGPIVPFGDAGRFGLDDELLQDRIAEIVNELHDDLMKFDPGLLKVLDVVAVAREFDYYLLEHIFFHELGTAEPDPSTLQPERQRVAESLARTAIRRLPEYSVIEIIHRDGEDEPVFRAHYLVREVMYARLAAESSPNYLQRLHALIAGYYACKERAYLEDSGEYRGMFRLEQLSWQNDRLEWLYHLFNLKDRNNARLQLVRVYLEAFDWWGWYMSFDFCDDLLVSWEQSQTLADRPLVDQLREFQEAYPEGMDKHHKGSWETVHRIAQNLIAYLKLTLPPDKMNADQRMVRGHLERFSADAFRFCDPPLFPLSEKAYHASWQYFATDWNKAWIVNYLAELNLEWALDLAQKEHHDEAKEKFRAADRLARESTEMALAEPSTSDQDHELIAQNYRVLGDAFRVRGDWQRATSAYLGMLAHAYIFHFLDGNLDEYSFGFFSDLGTHVVQVLLAAASDGEPAVAAASAAIMRSFWEDNALFYADSLLSPTDIGFDLEAALVANDAAAVHDYVLPRIPAAGASGEPVEIGIAVSQTLFSATFLDNAA